MEFISRKNARHGVDGAREGGGRQGAEERRGTPAASPATVGLARRKRRKGPPPPRPGLPGTGRARRRRLAVLDDELPAAGAATATAAAAGGGGPGPPGGLAGLGGGSADRGAGEGRRDARRAERGGVGGAAPGLGLAARRHRQAAGQAQAPRQLPLRLCHGVQGVARGAAPRSRPAADPGQVGRAPAGPGGTGEVGAGGGVPSRRDERLQPRDGDARREFHRGSCPPKFQD